MVAAHAVAVALVLPIRREPVLTAVTWNALTVPSTSASLAWESSSARVISTAVSSAVVSTVPASTVKVGMSLTAVMVRVLVALLVCGPLPAPLAFESVTL